MGRTAPEPSCPTRSLPGIARALLVIILLLASGCSVLGIRPQVKRLEEMAFYRGTATRLQPSTAPIVVVLYDRAASAIVFYDVLLKDGPYYLVARPGRYEVFAFDDANRNFVLDPGEAVGFLDGAPVDIHASPDAIGSIVVGTGAAERAPAIDLSASGLPAVMQRRAESLGRIVTLDEPMFSPEKSVEGLWKPADFAKAGRSGIFFLHPYDPAKIPVLFVHGIGGSPRELRSVALGLDQTRFQPWFFHYPSGFSLDLNGLMLAQYIEELRGRLGFTRIFVVAHSMGGLVTASCLESRARDGQAPLIDLFVTISTPWLGSAAASSAPAPLAMPSWNDVKPDSDFLRRLSSLERVDKGEYCLLFSHSGDSRMISGGDDGTVTISSQLPYQAENAASFIYGFAENHSSILENKVLIAMVARMADNKGRGLPAAEGLRDLARAQ